MKATITEHSIDMGTGEGPVAYWWVKWGPGLTQAVVCLDRAEADRVAILGQKGVAKTAEPLVSFRGSR
jgi:hypothetical protein